MAVRAKFQVVKITQTHYGSTIVGLSAMYDTSIPEDQRFYDATPSGDMTMHVNNPAALEQLQLGKYFYLDLTPVSE